MLYNIRAFVQHSHSLQHTQSTVLQYLKTDVSINTKITVQCKNNHIWQLPASIYISFTLLSKKMWVKIWLVNNT